MRPLGHLISHDIRLVQRYQVIAISILVTVIYMAAFWGLSHLGATSKVLILIIFNDPILIGFLFVGVMLLFEQNENTLEALSVSPMKLSHYIWSKTLILTAISWLCCLAMALAGQGLSFDFWAFSVAVISVTMQFGFIGFMAVAGVKAINVFILRGMIWIILLGLPFLSFFELAPKAWFYLFPTLPTIELLSYSLIGVVDGEPLILWYALALVWTAVLYALAHRALKNSLNL